VYPVLASVNIFIMRLWSLHPQYLDVKGLLALWREGLLAQKVLLGHTRGYTNHPQLIRFKDTGHSIGAIATYLRGVVEEAERRGYCFDRSKITNRYYRSSISVSRGQIEYEVNHLLGKLSVRDKQRYRALNESRRILLHPMFTKVHGPVADWERTQN